MKKLIFALFVAAFAMTSCSTALKTAKQDEVKPKLTAAVIGDLDVSDQKITYTYVPTKAVRRGGFKNCKATAISEALKQYGDADVLVETREATVVRTGLFHSRRIKSITVTGYPAKYKSFHEVDHETIKKSIINGNL